MGHPIGWYRHCIGYVINFISWKPDIAAYDGRSHWLGLSRAPGINEFECGSPPLWCELGTLPISGCSATDLVDDEEPHFPTSDLVNGEKGELSTNMAARSRFGKQACCTLSTATPS